jgi:hypothetical protein
MLCLPFPRWFFVALREASRFAGRMPIIPSLGKGGDGLATGEFAMQRDFAIQFFETAEVQNV